MRLTCHIGRVCCEHDLGLKRPRTCRETFNSELYPSSIKTTYNGHAISQRKLQPGGGDTFNSGWDFSCSQLLSDQLSSRSDLEPELVVLCCFICCFTGLYLFRERGENSLLTSRDGSVAQMLLLIHFIYLKFNQTIDSRQIKTFNTQIKLNKIAHFNKEQRFEFI